MTIDTNDFQALAQLAMRTTQSDADRRAYFAKAKRESRDRQRKAVAEGKGFVHTDTIRDLLADIAIAMIAVDAPGHETIMSGLDHYFGDRKAWPVQIKQKAKSGKLKPKVLVDPSSRSTED